MDLAIEHSPGLVLLALGGDDLEAMGFLFGHDADDTARADIERKEAFLALTPGGCPGLGGAFFARLLFRRCILKDCSFAVCFLGIKKSPS